MIPVFIAHLDHVFERQWLAVGPDHLGGTLDNIACVSLLIASLATLPPETLVYFTEGEEYRKWIDGRCFVLEQEEESAAFSGSRALIDRLPPNAAAVVCDVSSSDQPPTVGVTLENIFQLDHVGNELVRACPYVRRRPGLPPQPEDETFIFREAGIPSVALILRVAPPPGPRSLGRGWLAAEPWHDPRGCVTKRIWLQQYQSAIQALARVLLTGEANIERARQTL